MREIITGTVEGTGAAINVSVGFVPSVVEIFNLDDAGSLCPQGKWISGMADDSAIKSLAVVDSGSSGNSSTELITSGGITPYDGSDSASVGFTIGTDTDLNADGETILWVAYR